MFRLYDCDCGVTIRGVNYDFEHVGNVTIEDPERTRLVRGSNGGNDTGLIYKEGIKEAKTVTCTVLGLPADLHNLLKEVYASKERLDFYAVSRSTGASKIAKKAILSQEPKQLTLDDSAESLNVALLFESFNITEVLKDA